VVVVGVDLPSLLHPGWLWRRKRRESGETSHLAHSLTQSGGVQE